MCVSTSFHQAVATSVIPSCNFLVYCVKFSICTQIGNMLLCFCSWDCFLWHEMGLFLELFLATLVYFWWIMMSVSETPGGCTLFFSFHFFTASNICQFHYSTSTTSCWCYTSGSSFHYSAAPSHISSFLWSWNKPWSYTILSETSSLKSSGDVVRSINYFR